MEQLTLLTRNFKTEDRSPDLDSARHGDRWQHIAEVVERITTASSAARKAMNNA